MGREHHVVISDLDERRLAAAAAELRGLGIDCTPLACDVTRRSSVVALFERAAARGRVSAVVHAAGISPQMAGPEAIVRVNALGTVNVAEAFLPLALEGSALVNVA